MPSLFESTTRGTVARSGRNTRSKDAYAEFTSTWASTGVTGPVPVHCDVRECNVRTRSVSKWRASHSLRSLSRTDTETYPEATTQLRGQDRCRRFPFCTRFVHAIPNEHCGHGGDFGRSIGRVSSPAHAEAFDALNCDSATRRVLKEVRRSERGGEPLLGAHRASVAVTDRLTEPRDQSGAERGRCALRTARNPWPSSKPTQGRCQR